MARQGKAFCPPAGFFAWFLLNYAALRHFGASDAPTLNITRIYAPSWKTKMAHRLSQKQLLYSP
jgi:hypothetical protein